MSKKCGQLAESLISGYLDDVLCPRDQWRVQAHLQRCAGCRQLLRDLRKLRNTLLTARRTWQRPDPVPCRGRIRASVPAMPMS